MSLPLTPGQGQIDRPGEGPREARRPTPRGPATVLHLIDTGGPGGAETIYAELVGGLDRNHWRSITAVPERDWLHAELEARGIEPVLLTSRGSFDVGYLAALFNLVRRHRVDLIHAHLLTTSVYGSLVGRLTGVPVICTFHGQPDLPPDERFRAAKLRIIDRRSNRITFVSEALRRWFLERTSLTPARTAVVHNGIDPARFAPTRDRSFRDEIGARPDQILVGAIGNLRRSKDYPTLLRAAAVLHGATAAYRFVIVGHTEERLYAELLALRASLGLDDVVAFTGFREDVERILNALDLFIITSNAEGFSLATVQAMACGVPVVATRCGGPEEIIDDGVTGILTEPGEPELLASAIQRLGHDADLRLRLTAAARGIAANRFSIDAMIRGYEALYEERMRKHPPHAGARALPAESGRA